MNAGPASPKTPPFPFQLCHQLPSGDLDSFHSHFWTPFGEWRGQHCELHRHDASINAGQTGSSLSPVWKKGAGHPRVTYPGFAKLPRRVMLTAFKLVTLQAGSRGPGMGSDHVMKW